MNDSTCPNLPAHPSGIAAKPSVPRSIRAILFHRHFETP
jgi:hypothetical protein